MGKLSNNTTALKPKSKTTKSPIKTKKFNKINPGGGVGTELKAKSQLFLTAISTFAGEDRYYEGGQERIDRVVKLTHKITKSDPEWLQRFIPWLRGPEVNIRTISLIIAAEYVAAGGPDGAKVIDSVCQRADEPAEILAYWMQAHYGWDGATYPLPSPKLPQALRKGLARAASRLYDEYSAIKYDGNSRGVGMANVLNLVHPATKDYPSALTKEQIEQKRQTFQFIIDKSYGNELKLDNLPLISANYDVRKLERAELLKLDTDALKSAGVTWEQFGGLLNGPWTAEAWENLIPTMGYMALLRNLSNFESAGISKASVNLVNSILTNPEKVRRSRQLPFRFLSAYKNVNSSNYLQSIEEALDLSTQNIPTFGGRTLVMVDKSGSMDATISNSSTIRIWELGALFASSLAKAGQEVDLHIFADSQKRIEIPKGSSVIRSMERLEPNNGVGHGTNIYGSIMLAYDPGEHDRVIVFTDMQDNTGGKLKKLDTFIHFFDVAGYGWAAPHRSSFSNSDKMFYYGGFSDATFKMMALLEQESVGWPF